MVTVDSTCSYLPGCLGWCLDGGATWWSVELGRLYYLTVVEMVDQSGVVTSTSGKLDVKPFDMVGSRNKFRWIDIYDVSRFIDKIE